MGWWAGGQLESCTLDLQFSGGIRHGPAFAADSGRIQGARMRSSRASHVLVMPGVWHCFPPGWSAGAQDHWKEVEKNLGEKVREVALGKACIDCAWPGLICSKNDNLMPF